MPASEHHYGVQDGAVILDWYCDICSQVAYERVTCKQVPMYPAVVCPLCEKANSLIKPLMDFVGMEYPSGIYTFRDHLKYHLRTLNPCTIPGYSLRDRQLNAIQLRRCFRKAGKDLKQIEEQYLL